MFLLVYNCKKNAYSNQTESNTILNLKWNKAYSDDTIDKSLIGLKWALSYVGATLPNSNEGFFVTDSMISIEIKKQGFSDKAQKKLNKLNKKIYESQEYKQTNTIDLGRYISLLIGASEHYYEITGTPKTLDNLLKKYTLLPQEGYINNSGVSLEHRIIQFSEQNDFNQLFISTEIDPITNEIYEYETVELLPNGQVRFGIFDTKGNRKTNADPSHSMAGKPAKCMWCHESNIQPMIFKQDDYEGYMKFSELKKTIKNYRDANKKLKETLSGGVDYSKNQQHTLTELLYISFMEPSAKRLSLEWNMTEAEVKVLLSDYPTHVYEEFPFLGHLYDRNTVENEAPFKGIEVSSSVREKSQTEVNYLN